MGPLPLNILAPACHSACHTATEREAFGPQGPRICRCHVRAKSICHTVFLKEWSLEPCIWGTVGGLLKVWILLLSKPPRWLFG